MDGIGPPVHAKGHLRGEEGQEPISLGNDLGQAVGAQVHRGADIGHLFGDLAGLGRGQADKVAVGADNVARLWAGADGKERDPFMRKDRGAGEGGKPHQAGQVISAIWVQDGDGAIPETHQRFGCLAKSRGEKGRRPSTMCAMCAVGSMSAVCPMGPVRTMCPMGAMRPVSAMCTVSTMGAMCPMRPVGSMCAVGSEYRHCGLPCSIGATVHRN